MTAFFTSEISSAISALAWVLALAFCWLIRADYKPSSTMGTSWLLLAACCALSALRHAYEFFLRLSGWVVLHADTWAGLRQIPIVLSLVCLTAGLWLMRRAFVAVGLGTRLRQSDLVWAAAVLLLVTLTFVQRERMADAHSAWAVIRLLQSASPVLLGAPALAGLALHRISLEIGEGPLARSLRFIVASLLLRLVALWISNQPATVAGGGLHSTGHLLFWAAHWIFVLGLWFRWRLTTSARAAAARYGLDPEREVAGLARLARL